MKHVVDGWLLGMRKGATQPKHLEASGLEPTHVCWMICHMCETRKMCVCVKLCAFDEVFCLHTPSRARHSLMSVREICAGKTSAWLERVCSHSSSHQCWLCHSPWCWVAYFRTQSRQNLHRLYGRAQKSWDQFDEYDSPKGCTASCNLLRSPYALKFEDRSQEDGDKCSHRTKHD